ncbi:MAG: alcohol dehydrogenase catalytic domain-containing protein [Bryobacteraceae bacterium]
MRALTLSYTDRTLAVRDLPEPDLNLATEVLLRVHEVGVCATDRELAAFRLGRPPADSDFLVPGHEGLAQVAGIGSAVAKCNIGDWVVPIVRKGCRPLCPSCSRGRADLCVTGRYTESGLFGRHGYWRRLAVESQDDLVRVPRNAIEFAILTEPLSVAEKAIERAVETHPGGIARALVLGAGALGLLTAQALRLRGLGVAVFSSEPDDHPRAQWVRSCGMAYLTQMPDEPRFDLIVEACGSASAALAALAALAPLGVLVILGAQNALGSVPFHQILVNNQVILGSVNAGAAHYRAALDDLARMDPAALRSLIERRRFDDYERSFFGPASASAKLVHTLADPR